MNRYHETSYTWDCRALVTGDAGESAVERAAGAIISRMQLQGLVTSVMADGNVMLNIGARAGVKLGDRAQFGYYTDHETGLILCGHRYYDPVAGRWLTRDPIGVAGGINLYAYCGNNPVSGIDPEGYIKGGSYTDLGGYIGEVGDVWCGYGDVLNPVKWAEGLGSLAGYLDSHSIRCADTWKTMGSGFVNGLKFWEKEDCREFGTSFGTDLLLVAPLIKKIPNITPSH